MRWLILLALVITGLHAAAQDSVSLVSTDLITFDLYEKQEWDELIRYGESALGRNEDFYYLRYRLGVARFTKAQYRLALYQFEKAWSMQQGDSNLAAYISYCRLYTGQYAQALRVRKWIPVSKSQSLQSSPLFFYNMEAGIKLSSVDSLYQTMSYAQGGLGLRVGNAMTVYGAVSALSQKAYYGELSQQELYLGVQVPLGRGWLIAPAAHYIHYKVAGSTIQLPPHEPLPGNPPPPPVSYTFPDHTGEPLAVSLLLSRNISDWCFTADASYASLFSQHQHQQRLSAAWFPMHNQGLMLEAGLQVISDDTMYRLHPVAGFSFRWVPVSRLAISGAFTSIHARTLVEQNAYLMNNSFDETGDRYQVSAVLALRPRLNLYASWMQEEKTESYYRINYRLNMFMAGLKMSF
jgi:hypothetical protein